MPPARLAPVVLLALLLPLGGWASPAPRGQGAGADAPTRVGCGQTSPLSNACSAGVVFLRQDPLFVNVTVTGFVGHLRVDLDILDEDGRVWSRNFDIAGQALVLSGYADSPWQFDTPTFADVSCHASGLQAVYADGQHNAGRTPLPAPLPTAAGIWRCDVTSS